MTPRIFAAVLAAGRASRFGSTKQLADFEGSPMVRRVVQTATRVCGAGTLLVTGHDRAAVARACAGLPGFVTVNHDYRHGIGSSIAHAARVLSSTASAILVILADQPRIPEQHLQAMIDAWSGDDNAIVATSYRGTRGAPVLFPRACFTELTKLDRDSGGRHLINDERFAVRTVECEAAALDVDTPEDLTQISRSARS
jgi:molybdenum cofactor cytidylyltransferase